MVAGGAKAELEQYHLSVTLPNVVIGDNHEICLPHDAAPFHIPFETCAATRGYRTSPSCCRRAGLILLESSSLVQLPGGTTSRQKRQDTLISPGKLWRILTRKQKPRSSRRARRKRKTQQSSQLFVPFVNFVVLLRTHSLDLPRASSYAVWVRRKHLRKDEKRERGKAVNATADG